LPRRRSVHVHACVLLYYTALKPVTTTEHEQRIARDCVRRVVVLVEFDTIKYNSWYRGKAV
jgi:hypothetical protein